MPSKQRLPRLGLLLLAALACGKGSERSPGPGEGGSLSSGLPIHDTLALACETLFQPGDSIPPRVSVAVRAADGTFAWQPVGTSMLVIRRDDGSEVRVAGTDSLAPFRTARQLGWLGDTLWLVDLESTRLQRFLKSGQRVGPLLAPNFATWTLLPGRLLRATAPRGIAPGDTTVVLIGAAEGAGPLDTLAQVSAPRFGQIHLPQGSRLNLLTTGTRAIVTGNGARWCAVRDVSGPVSLLCFDAVSGVKLLEREIRIPRRPVTDAIFDLALRSVRVGRTPLDSLAPLVDRPDSLPFATDLLTDNEAQLWVGRSFPGEPLQRWLRIAPDGTPLDEVQLPARYNILVAAGDSLWVSERDQAGMERVNSCKVQS